MNVKVFILIFLIAVGLTSCSTSTVSNVSQVQPSATPMVIVVTATPLIPTQTPWIVTSTPPPTTATPLATATSLATATFPATPAATKTLAPTPTSVPSATATSSGPKYPPPVLGWPTDNYNYYCAWGPLDLYWSGAELGPNEWFLVETTKQDHPNEWGAIAELQKGYSLSLNPVKVSGGCTSPFFGGIGIYNWRVWIVSSPDSNPAHVKEFLSPASLIRAIRYW